MNHSPTTRASLLLRLADAENQQAWMEFVALYEPLVHRLLRKAGLQDADVREVAQEVFLAVSLNVARFEPNRGPGSFRVWLRRVTRNLLINVLAHQRRRPVLATGSSDLYDLLEELPEGDDQASALVDWELRRRLLHHAADTVRKEVRPATWEAFWRTFVEGEQVTEVAENLGVSAGAVYVARSRVVARLRREVDRIRAEDET
jgi:RNA polymerase sigma-70 factor (ECF subfamily)